MRKGLIINFTVEYFNFILLNPAYISETHFKVYQPLRLSGIITVIITTFLQMNFHLQCCCNTVLNEVSLIKLQQIF